MANTWIPAFAGMTSDLCVAPAEAGVQYQSWR